MRSYRESTGFDFLGEGSAKNESIITFLVDSMRVSKLVRSDGSMVNINSLRGKIVGLLFTSPPTKVFMEDLLIKRIQDLASAYNELSKSKEGQFEIVWIGADDYLQFVNYLKMMPWLAIPYTYSDARIGLLNLAEINESEDYDLFLFNRQGKLFRKKASYLFSIYGPDWYPFTDTRIVEIEDEDDHVHLNKSLKMLLANPARDFVVTTDGTKVPISTLENKVVGIYLCNMDYLNMTKGFTRQLHEVYLQLQKMGQLFEIVMVHSGFSCPNKNVNPHLENLSWLSLPRGDSNGKRLVRMFEPQLELENRLVIVGPHGSFVNNFGYYAIMFFGIKAYPFSRSSIVEMEKKRLEELSLNTLLTCGDKNYVIQMNGEKIPVSNLLGKTILLLFTNFNWRKHELVQKLLKWYLEIKEKDADFEIILVAHGYDESSFGEEYCQMPWLALPHNDTRILTLRSALKITYTTFSVFGPNGQLLSMNSEFHFYEKGANAYPFSGNDLFSDVCRVLSTRYEWPVECDDKNGQWQEYFPM